MKQEDKDLLIRDLCARLPYGVRIAYRCNYIHELRAVLKIGMVLVANVITDECISTSIENVIPYLFPLSSMTEEQTEEVHNLIYQGISESVDETKEWLKTRKENELRPITLTYILSYKLVIDWFCKNHIDYRGLIPKGLAIDATGLNIY